VVIGLLVTGDGIPIAHRVVAGNTRDSTTLPAVMADYQARFGVGRIALVADRGLIFEANLAAVTDAGFDHVIATRLHRDPVVAEVLRLAARRSTAWTRIDDKNSVCEIGFEGHRYVIVDSAARTVRDDARTQELLARTAGELDALAERVTSGRLVDPAKTGVVVDRVLHDSGVARCFAATVGAGRFTWEYDAAALHYELNLLQGRYVISTSLTANDASAVEVYSHYRSLARVERRFRVMKDFLSLRPAATSPRSGSAGTSPSACSPR
jgi:Transposase DDE domain